MPEGQRLELGSEQYDALEGQGLEDVRALLPFSLSVVFAVNSLMTRLLLGTRAGRSFRTSRYRNYNDKYSAVFRTMNRSGSKLHPFMVCRVMPTLARAHPMALLASIATTRRPPNQVKYCGFVLVAGGLGERLGYGDIKLRLPSETCTMTTYLQLYIGQILHLQSR